MGNFGLRKVHTLVSAVITGLGLAAVLLPTVAFTASPPELCAAMLQEIRSLAREIQTDCSVRSHPEGQNIVFITDYRAFADNHQARSYLLYVFGSAGRMLNRNIKNPQVASITLADDALTRQGMRFSISAADLKRLQSAASTGALSLSGFHNELIRTGRFARN